MAKVAVASLGCAKNLVDTENMLGILRQKGFEIENDESMADIIIVNTCCFVNDAKQESIDTILDVAQWKQDGNCKKLVVTGCLAQRFQEEIIKELPEVDIVAGVGSIEDIAEIIEKESGSIFCEKPYKLICGDRIQTTPSYTAYVKISDGCDNCCTYCVIPSIRGRHQSRPMEDIVAEARLLVSKGVKEVILVAQDTTNYGTDIYGKPALCGLLGKICETDGLEWLRLHYCYPERITDELIDIIAKESKICKYIDIPIQHCNDQILARMGRKGSKKQIADVVNKLRDKVPGIAIRTTLITGFPGETEQQYLELKDFIREMRFDRLGVFAYSQEENTPAADMEDQVPEEVKQQRREMLAFTQSEVAEEISKEKTGKTLKVLVEGYDTLVKQYFGRSEADSVDIDGKVFFKSKNKLEPGEFVYVTVNEVFECDLFGEQAKRGIT